MAVQVVSQLVGSIIGIPGGDATDVESDSTAAVQGTLNVFVQPQAGNGAFITIEPIPESVASLLANGPCTVTISQGAGTLNVAVAQ